MNVQRIRLIAYSKKAVGAQLCFGLQQKNAHRLAIGYLKAYSWYKWFACILLYNKNPKIHEF